MSSQSSDPNLRPPEAVAADDPRLRAVASLIGIVDRLRAPDGCPWDLEQTEESLMPSLIEEAFELQEAVEEGAGAVGEAGDVLMNVVLIARIAEDEGRYDLEQVAAQVSEKLVRRHPHVFGELTVESTGEVLRNWEAIKKAERESQQQDSSALAGVPRALPALQRAERLCGKALAAGFRWDDAAGALAKVEEELVELQGELSPEVLQAPEPAELDAHQRERIAAELGDLLMAAAFLGRYLKIDPERALRDALRRFEGRFRWMEARVEGSLAERSLEELMTAWREAKQAAGAAPGR